jgi:sialate O-acetylesterase
MKWTFLLSTLSATALQAADLRLAGLFTDHMVLQRDQPITVWGEAAPGARVTVTFAGQTKTTQSTAAGAWRLQLAPEPARAQPEELRVTSDQTSGVRQQARQDVLVGDVWLCSGQSNMHFQMKSTEDAVKQVAAADRPLIRFFTTQHQFSQKAGGDVQGAWKPVSPATAADCSAVACYFGMALQPKIDVPVGLIISSVGGTRIECWMRPETLDATGASADLLAKWHKIGSAEFAQIGAAYEEFQRQRDREHPQAVRAAKAKGEPPPPAPQQPKLRCHDCPSALHHGMIAPLEPFALRGAFWYQGESNAGQPAPYVH